MKPFQIFRYLKQAKWVIIVASLLLGILFYTNIASKQSYTAQSALRYADAQSANPGDITTAAVLNKAISDYHLSIDVEALRSSLKILEMIPAEEKEKMESAVKLGNEYTYYPTDFKITLTLDSKYSAQYARVVLNAVLDSYMKWYAQNSVHVAMLPGNLTDLRSDSFDYLEKVDKLNSFLTEMISFLGTKASGNLTYRSAQTGYSFNDIKAQYSFINENILPYLYVEVLDNALTMNSDVLMKKYVSRYDALQVEIDTMEQKAKESWEVISRYTDKNKEGQLYYNSSGARMADEGDNGGSVLGQVYNNNDNGERVDRATTYDDLIESYTRSLIKAQKARRQQEIVSEYIETMSKGEGGSAAASTAAAEVDALLARVQNDLDHMYNVLTITMDEYLDYVAATQVSVMSSIHTTTAVNTKTYLIVMIAVLGVLGCGGAVVVGRLADFVEYFVFMEPKLNIFNRKACDSHIDGLDGKVLGSNYTVFYLRLCNIREINLTDGRDAGNDALQQIAHFLKDILGENGFVGYNNNETFLCMVEDYPYEKAVNDVKIVRKLGETHCSENGRKASWKIAAGIANSTVENVYDIRKLISCAYALSNRDEQEGNAK